MNAEAMRLHPRRARGVMNLPDQQPSPSLVSRADRRRYPRYSVQVQIEIRQEGYDVPLRVVTTDLSRRGCYVQLMIPLPVGTQIRATLWLDGYAAVIRGSVVTRHPQFGNGIMFQQFEGEAEQHLSKYLDAISNG